MCGIGLSISMGVWIYNQKSVGSINQKKFQSWAMTVPIDPAKSYPVIEVIDGDTLKTIIDGHNITIRLLGVNTPETLDPRKPAECFGPEASALTKSLLIGKSILISLNPNYERIDKFGRLLAYVRLDEDSYTSSIGSLFVNEYLIKEGYGREYTFNKKKPYQYQKLFKKDEFDAKNVGKGLWGKCVEKNQD